MRLQLIGLLVTAVGGQPWSQSGAPASDSYVKGGHALAVDECGTPVVAFADYAHGDELVVRRRREGDGGTWANVGNASAAYEGGGAAIRYPQLALTRDGSIVCAFQSLAEGAGERAVALIFDRGSPSRWSSLGGEFPHTAVELALAAAPAANHMGLGCDVFLAFLGDHVSRQASVSCSSSAAPSQAWKRVGPEGFAQAPVKALALAIGGESVYTAYADGTRFLRLSVRAYVRAGGNSAQAGEGEWKLVGDQGLSAGSSQHVSIAVAPGSDAPWVAYSDASLGGRLVVRKWSGVAWVDVGGGGGSASERGLSAAAAISATLLFLPESRSSARSARAVVVYIAPARNANAIARQYDAGADNGTLGADGASRGWPAIGAAGTISSDRAMGCVSYVAGSRIFAAFQGLSAGSRVVVVEALVGGGATPAPTAKACATPHQPTAGTTGAPSAAPTAQVTTPDPTLVPTAVPTAVRTTAVPTAATTTPLSPLAAADAKAAIESAVDDGDLAGRLLALGLHVSTVTIVDALSVTKGAEGESDRVSGGIVLWGTTLTSWGESGNAELALRLSIAAIASTSQSAVAIVAVAQQLVSARRRRRRRRLAVGVAVNFVLRAPAGAKGASAQLSASVEEEERAMEEELEGIVLGVVAAAVATVLITALVVFVLFVALVLRHRRKREARGAGEQIEFTRLGSQSVGGEEGGGTRSTASSPRPPPPDLRTKPPPPPPPREIASGVTASAARGRKAPVVALRIDVDAFAPELAAATNRRVARRGRDQRSPRSRRFSWNPRHWSGFLSPSAEARKE